MDDSLSVKASSRWWQLHRGHRWQSLGLGGLLGIGLITLHYQVGVVRFVYLVINGTRGFFSPVEVFCEAGRMITCIAWLAVALLLTFQQRHRLRTGWFLLGLVVTAYLYTGLSTKGWML